MPRPSLSLYTFAPVLAALFAVLAIALVLISRPQRPPSLMTLAVIDAILLRQSSGVGGTTLRLAVGGKEYAVDAGACAAFTGVLRPGDPLAVWVDKGARAWRITRLQRPVCTFAQASVAVESSRHTRRVAAIVLAVAAVACVGLTVLSRRQVQLIDEGSAA